MHNFVFALILVAAVLVAVTANSIVVCSTVCELKELLEAGRVEDAYDLWESKKRYLSLSVHQRTIDIVEEEAENMNTYHRWGKKTETDAARLRMLAAIDEIRNSEFPDFFNIFCVDNRDTKVYYKFEH